MMQPVRIATRRTGLPSGRATTPVFANGRRPMLRRQGRPVAQNGHALGQRAQAGALVHAQRRRQGARRRQGFAIDLAEEERAEAPGERRVAESRISARAPSMMRP